MTDQEVQAFLNKPVRLTLADGRVFAGMLSAEGHAGHGHPHYAVTSDPLQAGRPAVREIIHGSDHITNIELAEDDKAAHTSAR